MKKISSLLYLLCFSSFAFSQIKLSNSITFKVDNVKKNKQKLYETKIDSILHYKLNKTVKFYPPSHKNVYLVGAYNNAFIETVEKCYADHRTLILSPDMIWLLITQGTSIHINQNFETLKNRLFKDSSDNKIEIAKRNDSLSFEKDNWSDLFTKISEQTNKNLKEDLYRFFVPQFSTTTPINKTVFEVTLLDAVKKKFVYVAETGCGIPSITIKGTKQDWQWIYDNLSKLDKIEMGFWKNELQPIIQEFINAVDNKINTPFWKDIFKNASEYNGHYLSGWIIKFYPYLMEVSDVTIENNIGEDFYSKVELIYKKNEYLENNNYLKSFLLTKDFPSGISSIDFKWIDYWKKTEMNLNLYAGFIGAKQYKDLSLEPFISWAITDTVLLNKELDVFNNVKYSIEDKSVKHQSKWSPYFAKIIIDSAIFDKSKFVTTEASLEFLKSFIIDSLRKSIYKDSIDKNITISIEVLSNSTIGNVYTINYWQDKYGNEYEDKNPISNFENYIKKILESLPNKWSAAIAANTDVLQLIDPTKKELKAEMKVNSYLKIYFGKKHVKKDKLNNPKKWLPKNTN